jgi:hypothetical protein
MLNSYRKLSFYEKATLLAICLESIVITLGVIVALFQFFNSSSELEADQNKESLVLLSEYRATISDYTIYPRNLRYQIHQAAKTSNNDLDRSLTNIDYLKLLSSSNKLTEYLDRVYDCYKTEVCSEYIAQFICGELYRELNPPHYSYQFYMDIIANPKLVKRFEDKVRALEFIESDNSSNFNRFCQ